MNPLAKAYCRIYQTCFRIALPILPYRNPEQLNGIEEIPTILNSKHVKSLLLVADGGVRRLGLTQPLEELLKEAGITCHVYEQNRPNPTIDDVEQAVLVYREGKATAIIAIGGGSAMDCAKAAGARIARPHLPVSKMKGILKILLPTPLMIAIPTTAGTGSEATLAAVITDAKTHHKYPINDFPLIPDYAVLDPSLTLGLPPFITATTGLDALTHAVEAQRTFFQSGATLPLSFRHEALRKLRDSIRQHENEINAALRSDLGKCPSETYMCETGMTLSELTFMDKHIDRWWRPHLVPSPLAQFHATSFTVRDPYGVVLIMSPWNYPFMLTMEPLIGAIACGNCCVVKPSAYSPSTSKVIAQIISECFPPEYVTVVEGGREENKTLLNQKFDYIFFTGGVNVGKEVMRHAAESLTPVTLELGGKSPVIVDSTANLKLAAKRLAFGKLLNCGQTCVAPDYLLIDRKVEKKFLSLLTRQISAMVGKKPLQNKDYVHMINRKHFDRVMGLIDPDKVILGGKGNTQTLRIQPTIMTGVTAEDKIMQEEIFGPVLPVITYDNIDEAFAFINERPHPLACYLFSDDKKIQKRYLRELPFGGGCINDTIIHLATSQMGFGGVGGSGMGSYHGKKSLETFSHEKSIVNKHTWLDLPMRYAPYHKIYDMLIRFFLR